SSRIPPVAATSLTLAFSFQCSAHHRDRHSFPTRRSSDLMVRAGLDMDLQGMTVSEPADVAREVLESLTLGPVHVVGGEQNQKQVAWSSGTDRGRIVAGAAKRMKALRGDA